ncbi:MAG: polysaccharide biosynthesis C-terminal domain-containing protein [Deltaproteobacteria bacterium]|nr:polysaccharide biosynthesis C-terminal domain-containing protein [Deltaproteobacteria bacterium]
MKRDAKAFFKYNLFNTIFYSIIVFLLVILLKLGALGFLTSSLLTGIIVGLYCFFKLVKKIEIDKAILKDALLFCWPLIIAASMNYFFMGIDRAMLEQINDNYNLGLYNVAFGITGYLALFHIAISQTFQPDIFQAVAANNKKKIIKIVGGINLLNAIPIIAFIAFAPLVIKILTFDRFTEASQFARILALKNITTCIYFSMSSIIIAYGYSRVTLLNKITGTVICVVMFKVLISKYGFFGAAWGQVLSFFFMSAISSMFLIYKFKTRKSAYL